MTKVEEVARAIEEQIGPGVPGIYAAARAAIEAMRSPTPGMVKSVYDGDFDIYWSYRADGTPGGCEDVFNAMIDAALADGGKTE